MDDFPSRILPSNVQMEAALLGCLLNDGRLFSEVEGSGLKPEDFSQERHATVFRAIKSVFESQQTPDVLTVSEVISKMDNPVESSFVFDLANNAPIIYEDTLAEYCSVIIEKSLYREMIGQCAAAIDAAYAQKVSFDELSDRTTSALISLSNRRQVKSVIPIKALIATELQILKDKMERGSSISGISSGYPYLDSLCSGFKPGDMIVLAGRPGMGKTGFALNMALAIAKNNLNVLFFSLEMPASQIINRLLSIECSIQSQHLLNGKLDSDESSRLWLGCDKLSELHIFVDDTSNLKVSDLRSKAKKLDAELRKTPNPTRQTQNKLDCIFVDYLQIMDSTIFKEDKVRQIEDISKNIKGFAKDMGIPVIALAQLNRKIEDRRESSKIPMLSDLKDSGSIEQDADMVMFIHREDVYKKEEDRNNEADIWVQKNRHGQTGKVPLHFVGQYMKFTQRDSNADSYEK